MDVSTLGHNPASLVTEHANPCGPRGPATDPRCHGSTVPPVNTAVNTLRPLSLTFFPTDRSAVRLPVLLASGGALLICGGVALVSVPVAVVVAGVESLVAAYTVAYVTVRSR